MLDVCRNAAEPVAIVTRQSVPIAIPTSPGVGILQVLACPVLPRMRCGCCAGVASATALDGARRLLI